MAGGGRNHLVPPPSQVHAPRVGANPTQPVSRPPPRARPHRVLLKFPACALPQYVSALLSTTSHHPPPSFCRRESLRAADFLRPSQVPRHAQPLPRSRTRCRPPARCPSRRHACPRCWGRRRARCDRPRRVYRPPCGCVRRPLFERVASARRAGGTASASPTTPHRRAPGPRAPDTLSTPLPSLTSPSSSSLPSQLTPPSPLTPLVTTPISPHAAQPPCAVAPSLS